MPNPSPFRESTNTCSVCKGRGGKDLEILAMNGHRYSEWQPCLFCQAEGKITTLYCSDLTWDYALGAEEEN